MKFRALPLKLQGIEFHAGEADHLAREKADVRVEQDLEDPLEEEVQGDRQAGKEGCLRRAVLASLQPKRPDGQGSGPRRSE